MKKFRKSVYLIAAVFAAIVLLGACGAVGAALDEAAKLQSYDLGGDSVPSLTSVVGERKCTGAETGTSGGADFQQYSYETEDVTADMDAYYAALNAAGYIATTDSEGDTQKGKLQMGISAAEEGKAILVDLEWDTAKITVKATKADGTITKN